MIACLNVKLIDNFPAWTLSLGNFISASTLFGVILWALYMLVDALFIHKRVFCVHIVLLLRSYYHFNCNILCSASSFIVGTGS